MNAHKILSHLQHLKPAVLAAALLALFLILCGIGIVSSTAQSAQDDAKDERKFENTIPAHVPIKVKVKNEQAFKNLKNRNWARELEIEVKNTGVKPIYFMYMVIFLPDMIVNGNPAGFQVTYGRKDLVRLTTSVQPDDVPIQPGEVATLRISEAQVRGFEKLVDEEKRVAPKKVEFDLQLINFGDGTGLRSKQGRPHPDPNRKRSSNVPYINEGDQGSPPTLKAQTSNSSNEFSFYSSVPASFSRVKFSPPDKISTACATTGLPDLCGCQNTFNCFYGTADFATCPCDDPHEFLDFKPTNCSNPLGSCSLTRTVTPFCDTQYNGRQYCQFQEDTEVGCAIGDPTPTPTPDQTPPPPCPTPHDSTRPNESCYRFGPQCSQTWMCTTCGDDQLQVSYRSLA